jgi:hypothetical protein
MCSDPSSHRRTRALGSIAAIMKPYKRIWSAYSWKGWPSLSETEPLLKSVIWKTPSRSRSMRSGLPDNLKPVTIRGLSVPMGRLRVVSTASSRPRPPRSGGRAASLPVRSPVEMAYAAAHARRRAFLCRHAFLPTARRSGTRRLVAGSAERRVSAAATSFSKRALTSPSSSSRLNDMALTLYMTSWMISPSTARGLASRARPQAARGSRTGGIVGVRRTSTG